MQSEFNAETPRCRDAKKKCPSGGAVRVSLFGERLSSFRFPVASLRQRPGFPLHRSAQSLSEKWVARATSPFRWATCPAEWKEASAARPTSASPTTHAPFHRAGSPAAQAGGLCSPLQVFQTGSKPEPCSQNLTQRRQGAETPRKNVRAGGGSVLTVC